MKHINKVIALSKQLLGLIYSTIIYRDGPAFKHLYTLLVRTHLEYGHAAWHPCFKRDCINLERV